MKNIVTLLFLLIYQFSTAQSLQAKVVDENDEPLAGANVYFDGTTRGVITDFDGFFEIEVPANLASPILVISYLGYETIQIKELRALRPKYQLKPKPDSLDKVNIYTTVFTRAQMEKAFKKYFLGKGKAASQSEIKNLDDVILYYVSDENTLYAESLYPIEVENKYLGYHVKFELMDFEVKYRAKTLRDNYLKQTYYAGTTFFEDVNPDKESYRKKVYQSSLQNFFKQLTDSTLYKTDYKVEYRSILRDPQSIFKVIKPEDPRLKIHKVQLKPEYINLVEGKYVHTKFTLMHRGRRTTLLLKKPHFRIDPLGNLIDIKDVVLSGGLADDRVAKMLPLEYQPSH